MGIVSNAELIVSGVYLALGLMYLRFWWSERARHDYLAFTISSLSYAVFAWFELGMMHSQTPEEYLFYAWWAFLPGTSALLGTAWFIRIHLGGRRWMFWTYCSLRIAALGLHFIMKNGVNFREVITVQHTTILGETLGYPIAVPNPWMVLPHFSHLLLIAFCLDASTRLWRSGERRKALVFGGVFILFAVGVLTMAIGGLWGLVPVPMFASLAVLFIIGAMLYDMNYDMHRAAMLSETLEEHEARLTDTLDQLQLAAAAGNVGMWTRKVGEERFWLSEKAVDVWGFPAGMQVNMQDILQHMHPADREAFMPILREVEEEKKEYQIDYRFLLDDGSIRWIHSRGKVDEVDGSSIIRGAIVDVTELKMAEARLTDTLDQLQLAAAAANVGMWTRTVGDNKLWLSDKAGDILDLPKKEQFSREEFYQHIHPADRSLVFALAQEFEDGKSEFQLEYRILLKDGNVRWIHSRGKVEEVDGSRIIRGAIVDITNLKMAENAVLELSRKLMNAQEIERAHLARELHDDLSQSISLLSVNLTILRNEPEVPEQVQVQLDQYITDIERLSRNVRRISHELHPAILDQLGLEAALKNFCSDLAAAHSVRIEFEAEGLPPKLPFDISSCLYRVTQESLQNVVKHSGAASAKVSIISEDSEIRLSVSDNGTGFDPGTAKEKETLGLISIDERVRAVKGNANIISAIGEGTKIDVRIPFNNGTYEDTQNY